MFPQVMHSITVGPESLKLQCQFHTGMILLSKALKLNGKSVDFLVITPNSGQILGYFLATLYFQTLVIG
jgi:hypothetical protein